MLMWDLVSNLGLSIVDDQAKKHRKDISVSRTEMHLLINMNSMSFKNINLRIFNYGGSYVKHDMEFFATFRILVFLIGQISATLKILLVANMWMQVYQY